MDVHRSDMEEIEQALSRLSVSVGKCPPDYLFAALDLAREYLGRRKHELCGRCEGRKLVEELDLDHMLCSECLAEVLQEQETKDQEEAHELANATYVASQFKKA